MSPSSSSSIVCPFVLSYYDALLPSLEKNKGLNADLLRDLKDFRKLPFMEGTVAIERRSLFCLRYVVRESLLALGTTDTDTEKGWNKESLERLSALLRRLCEENTMEMVVDKMTGGTNNVLQLLQRDLERKSRLIFSCRNFLAAHAKTHEYVDCYFLGVTFYAVVMEAASSSDARVALFKELVAAGAP